MKISIIGPPLPIPPIGWGAVESLIWDMKLSLEKMGHQIQILNDANPNKMLDQMKQFDPDFVHINYDDWIVLYSHINYPCACTTHFAYLERPEMMGEYKERVFDVFTKVKPFVFGLSDTINKTYHNLCQIPSEKLFLNPNGVMLDNFRFTEEPKYYTSSIYLAKVDYRKRQHLFQSIPSLYYAGNIANNKFDTYKNYLGEWEKDVLYDSLTDYGNLVLLSDGEAHPLVCMEAFAAGLGVVVSQWGTANLDLDKKFITVIPEDKILDIDYVNDNIIKNREYSIYNRKEILEYAKTFEWSKILTDYYLPNIESII